MSSRLFFHLETETDTHCEYPQSPPKRSLEEAWYDNNHKLIDQSSWTSEDEAREGSLEELSGWKELKRVRDDQALWRFI
jgi:hypothetical protein